MPAALRLPAWFILFFHETFIFERINSMTANQKYEEQLLLRQFSEGEGSVVRYLFDRYFSKAKFYAVKIIDSDAEAEDIVMKIFAKLWKSGNQFESLEHLERYLFVAVHNACLKYKSHLTVVKRHESEVKHKAAAYTEDVLADHILIRAELTKLLYEEIQELPAKTREVILLQLVEGLKNSEIAIRLNMDESTVRSHRARAITLLRSAFLRKNLHHTGLLIIALLKKIDIHLDDSSFQG